MAFAWTAIHLLNIVSSVGGLDRTDPDSDSGIAIQSHPQFHAVPPMCVHRAAVFTVTKCLRYYVFIPDREKKSWDME